MKLTTLHQVLVVGAIALGTIYALRSVLMFTRVGQTQELGAALVGTLLAGGGALYLRRFRQKLLATTSAAAPAPSSAGEAL